MKLNTASMGKYLSQRPILTCLQASKIYAALTLPLVNLDVTNFTQGSNFDTLEDKQGQCKSWDWVQQYCRAWQMCIWQIWNVVIFKGTPCRSKFLDKFICWIISFGAKSTSGSSHKFWSSLQQTNWYLSLRLDMASEEVVLSNPAEKVFVLLNELIREGLDVDDLELTAKRRLLPFALLLMPMLSLTTITNFNDRIRVSRVLFWCRWSRLKAEREEGPRKPQRRQRWRWKWRWRTLPRTILRPYSSTKTRGNSLLGDWPRFFLCLFSSLVQPISFQEAKDVDVKEYFGKYPLSSL